MPKKKYSVVLSEELMRKPSGLAINAVAHMCAQLGTMAPELKGTAVRDSSGYTHSGLPIHPNVILFAKEADFKDLIDQATARGLLVVDYPREGFETSTDQELCNAIKKKSKEQFEYWGVTVYGDKATVDALTKRFGLWRVPFQPQ